MSWTTTRFVRDGVASSYSPMADEAYTSVISEITLRCHLLYTGKELSTMCRQLNILRERPPQDRTKAFQGIYADIIVYSAWLLRLVCVIVLYDLLLIFFDRNRQHEQEEYRWTEEMH